MTPTQAFEAYCEAFARGDHVAMAALFTEDGVFEASSLDAPLRGRKRLESQLRVISNSSRDIETEIRVALENGERGHFEGVYRAEIVGTGGKLDGSSHRIDFKFVALVEMRDGGIACLREHTLVEFEQAELAIDIGAVHQA